MPARPDLAKLVRQHAETSRLFGVDFVPVFRSPNAAHEAVEPERPAAEARAAIDANRPVASATASRPVSAAPSAPSTPPFPMTTRKTPTDATRAEKRRLLDEVRARYEADAPHQHFETEHTRIVFDDGDPDARLMFIGEAPGVDEDRLGKPFVGRSGQLLDRMIEAMGLSRDRVYIANVLKTRPPGNRTPTPQEAQACAPYLYDQIRIVHPEAIVTLGRPAAQLLFDTTESMGAMRGSWRDFPPPGGGLLGAIPPGMPTIPVMPTYHPAFLLRSYTPENRKKVWSDLQQVMERLNA